MPPKNVVNTAAIVKEEGFDAPFKAWVEIDGNLIPASGTKAGGDTHVSLQIMFSHFRKASEKPMPIVFKYKSTFNTNFSPFTGDTMMAST